MRKRLLMLYPEAWRDRYGTEMSALLDETPPSVAATLDLVRGALAAHLRSLPGTAPATRARSSIAGVLGCFIVFSIFGSGFAKTTENDDHAEHVHPLLGSSHSLILIAAIVAAGALVLAAAPLAQASLAYAHRTRDPTLFKLIALPPAGIGMFLGSVGLLALWLNAHHHRAGVGGWLLLGLCALCAAAGAVACWAAPRAIMRRIEIPRSAFAVTIPAMALVALCMVVIALAAGVFLTGIIIDSPNVGAAGNGPGQLIDVTISIAIALTAMLALSAIAVLSAVRGLRSLTTL
jgi:MFS family permease